MKKQLFSTLTAFTLGLLVSTARAQSVIFQLTGSATARDYFGGAGIVSNSLPGTVGTGFTDTQSATAGGGSATVTGTAVANTMTVTMTTVATSPFFGGGNFFIYTADADARVDTYILGAPGTPYDITIMATGMAQIVAAGGSSQAVGGTTGLNDPGWIFTWSLTGGTFTQSSVSDSVTLNYAGNVYSRVRPLPVTTGSSFFGITGPGDGTSGTGYYGTSQTVTTTVNNLGAGGASAPEPGSVALFTTGGLIWIIRRRQNA
nr:PEP-CTERM sorting domain-containing protein [Armatimonas sp.]